jgi:hypothetical protein
MELAPPFPGPIALNPYGVPVRNPIGIGFMLGAVALSLVGIGGVYMGYRAKHRGRLICRTDNFTIGVPTSYNGDWWADRGERLYFQARRDGHTSGEQIALAIIRDEISGGPYGAGESVERCMSQFPPHSETHPGNVTFWQNLMERVLTEMGETPPAPDDTPPPPGNSSSAGPVRGIRV